MSHLRSKTCHAIARIRRGRATVAARGRPRWSTRGVRQPGTWPGERERGVRERAAGARGVQWYGTPTRSPSTCARLGRARARGELCSGGADSHGGQARDGTWPSGYGLKLTTQMARTCSEANPKAAQHDSKAPNRLEHGRQRRRWRPKAERR